MTSYENFVHNFKPALKLSGAVSLITLISYNLTKDSIGFKNETNERIKSFLFTSASSAILFPLFYGDWNHFFDDDDDDDDNTHRGKLHLVDEQIDNHNW